MKRAIFISEIVGMIEDGAVSVCATADAAYNPEKGAVSVTLDAFTRRSPAEGSAPVHESWLPGEERITETLPREEADSFAREIFHGWCRKVRAAVPVELHLRA